MAEQIPGVRWDFDLTKEIGNDRSQLRTGVTRIGGTSRVVGYESRLTGGLRPSSGFRHIRDLTDPSPPVGGATLTYFDGFRCRTDANNWVWGFIYRLTDANGAGQHRWLIVYRVDASSTWYGPILLRTYSPITWSTARPWEPYASVAVHGRFVYVSQRGYEPFLFYIDQSTPGTPTVDTNTGPGSAPTLTSHKDPIELTGDLASIFTPSAIGADPPAAATLYSFTFTNDTLIVDRLDGPSTTGLWASPPQDDPTFTSNPVLDSRTGTVWTTGLSGVKEAVLYGFAYQLFDSRTGRRSALSERLQFTPIHKNAYAINSDGARVCFPAIDITYDEDRFDTLYLYRTVALASGSEAVYSLDGVYTLSDYHTDTQPNPSPSRRAFIWYELPDVVLIGQPTFQGDLSYDTDMPYAGATIYDQGAIIFGNIGTLNSSTGGQGLVRWSTLYETSPELLSPYNYFLLTQPGEEVLRFHHQGPNKLLLTHSTIYQARRETDTIRFIDAHSGYGVPTHRSSCVAGSFVYFVTRKGLKAVSPSLAIENIEAVDDIFLRLWSSTLDAVQLAYDAATGGVFCVNTSLQQTCILWLETSEVTELFDTNFSFTGEGFVPVNLADTTSHLEPRALFAQTIYPSSDSEPNWRIFSYDHDRQKTVSNDASSGALDPQISLLHPTRDTRFAVATTQFSLALDLYSDFSQFHTRTGGPYAGLQNNLSFSPIPVTAAPTGVCTLYTLPDLVSQFYINRGGSSGTYDLVPLYNDYYAGAGALLAAMVANVGAWCDIYVPDPNFSGIVPLDVERPLRWYLLGTADRTQWTADTFDSAGETEYNTFVQIVVEAIVAEIRVQRPSAQLGWWGLPGANPPSAFIPALQAEFDALSWLWTSMDVMLPNAGYLTAQGDGLVDDWASGHVTPAYTTNWVNGIIDETQRILTAAALSRPIYCYTWLRYLRGAPLNNSMLIQNDLDLVVAACLAQGIDGMIFWQSFGATDDTSATQYYAYASYIPDTFVPVMLARGGGLLALPAPSITLTPSTLGLRLEGCKIYVTSGPLTGRSATILRRTSTSTLRISTSDYANLVGIAPGDRVCISPVYCEWVGATLWITDPTSPVPPFQSYIRVRHANGLSCVFSDVTGDAAADNSATDARFQAALYTFNDTTASDSAFPVSPQAAASINSVVDGFSPVGAAFGLASAGLLGRFGYDSNAIFPAVRTFMTNLDYRLLSVHVTGSILVSSRTNTPAAPV